MAEIASESRNALRELIATLQEVDQRFLSAEWNLMSPADVGEASRALMHMLQGGLALQFGEERSLMDVGCHGVQ